MIFKFFETDVESILKKKEFLTNKFRNASNGNIVLLSLKPVVNHNVIVA